MGEKKEVSRLSLDFLLCGGGFAPGPSSLLMVPTVLDLATGERPRDLMLSLSWDVPESKLDTEGSESRDGRLSLDERDDLLDGIIGTYCRDQSTKQALDKSKGRMFLANS